MLRINASSRIGDFIDTSADTARLLTMLGANRKEHRSQTLGEFCAESGIDGSMLLDALLTPQPSPIDQTINWSAEPLSRLIDYIVARHHGFVRRQLLRLQLLIDRVCNTDGNRLFELRAIHEAFARVRIELQEHLVTEEEVLFPLIRGLQHYSDHRGGFMGTVDRPLSQAGQHVDEAGANLSRLRARIADFTSVGSEPGTYQTFLAELSGLEEDLKYHFALENDVLFPRALKLEQELMKV